MAGPIRIAVLADGSQAAKSMKQFADDVDGNVKRAAGSVSKAGADMRGGTDRVTEGFDAADTRAMGFRDTITGVQDSMRGFRMLTTSSTEAQTAYNEAVAKYGKNSDEAKEASQNLADAQASLGDKLFTLGAGVGDLASGFANFLVPAFAQGVGWIKNLTVVQRVLNITMLTNPVFLVVAAIVALVAILVVAYQKSETFRGIVQAVWNTLRSAWGAIPGFVSGVFGKVWSFFSGMQSKITGFFGGAGSWLRDAAGRVIQGFIDGLTSKFQSVRNTLSRLTNMLPDWKGPATKDAALLRNNGRLVMGGFQRGLEDEYGTVERSLNRFTAGLGGTVETGSMSQGNARSGVVVNLNKMPSGGLDRMFMQWLREMFRTNGYKIVEA